MVKKSSPSDKLPTNSEGFIPPQATELEEAVLGAMMVDKACLLDVMPIVHPNMMYKEAHAIILKSILDVYNRNEPVDILTVSQDLRQHNKLDEVGGASILASITLKVGSGAHAPFHAKIIRQKYILRTIITQSYAVINSAFREDFDDVLGTFTIATRAVDDLISGISTDKRLDAIMRVHRAEIDRRAALYAKGDIIGIPSGILSLDKQTGGWQGGELIVVGARPSMGKTQLALFFGRMAAERGNYVSFYSLETTDIKLADRLVCADGGIDPSSLKRGNMTKEEYRHYELVTAKFSKYNFYIDDNYNNSIRNICAKARSKKRKGEVDFIIIDFLQLVETDGERFESRERQVSHISRSLKMLAKELNIPILLLCQLSRAVEQRGGNKYPMLSDLRESGSIEQDADTVLFPMRPEYYGITDIEISSNETVPSNGIGILIRAKVKDGEVGESLFRYDKAITNIRDFDDRLGTKPNTASDIPY